MATPLELSYQQMEKDSSAEEYLQKKIDRFGELLPEVSAIRAVFRFHENRKSYTVTMTLNVPGSVIRVEERDSDLRAAIDKVSDLLEQRIKRYKSRSTEWKGKRKWQHVAVPEEEYPEVVDYMPSVKTINQYRSERPISTGEAVETMELLGAPCYLFRDSKNGKWAVVYSTEENLYGITYANGEK